MKTQVKRVLLSDHPYPELKASSDHAPYHSYDQWPCFWITHPDDLISPFVTAYTKEFEIQKERTIRIHVSGDERYELYLDYERIGRGSERGNPQNWFYETYDITLQPGTHRFSARVWSLGSSAPWAQLSVHHGFILSPEGKEFVELFGTGVSDWQVKRLNGYVFEQTGDPLIHYPGTGVKPTIIGDQFSWGWQFGEGSDWESAVKKRAGTNDHTQFFIPSNSHIMRPALLPAMLEQEISGLKVRSVMDVNSDNLYTQPVTENNPPEKWECFCTSGTVDVDPNQSVRVIIDLDNYYCAYQEITVSGGKGSEVRIEWAEALSDKNRTKQNRNDINGLLFRGCGNRFFPDGGDHRTFSGLWWNAGRYISLYIQTDAEALHIENISFTETRYPYVTGSSFESNRKDLDALVPVLWRGVETCSHETYMDCPYYEQLMYVGDTRLQVLTTYTQTSDLELPRKAILMLGETRAQGTPWVDCSFPNDRPKLIPSFSLWWVCMVHDYAMWRNDPATVQAMIPGVRSQVDLFLNKRNTSGLIETPPGWNYIDVAVDPDNVWKHGTPPGEGDVCVELNMIVVYTLQMAAELEDEFGDREVSERNRKAAQILMKTLIEIYFKKDKGLFSYTPAGSTGSEHSLVLALLSGILDEETKELTIQTLTSENNLAKTNIYFSHYLLEALNLIGRTDLILERLKPWTDLPDQGFRTTPEQWGSTRSDCHAWGAHPLFHFASSFCGIRPSTFGFRKVSIKPQPGSFENLSCTLPHPGGDIICTINNSSGTLSGTISLPTDIEGELILKENRTPLKPGTQEF